MPISIVLADDHQVFLQGLATLAQSVGMNVIGVVHDRDHLLPLIEAARPQVAVVDVGMPGMCIPQLLAVLRERGIPTAVVVLTGCGGEFAGELLAAGARGYVLKEQAFEELSAAIVTVNEGRIYVSPRVAGELVASMRSATSGAAKPTLTARQLDVLRLIAAGNTTKRIAGILGIHVKTIDNHRRLLREKLAVKSTAEMVRVAKELGVI